MLSDSELRGARSAADREASEVADIGSIAYRDVYVRHCGAAILAHATRDVDAIRTPVFQDAETVRALFTDDEIDQAILAYRSFRTTAGPSLSDITPDEMRSLIERVSEGASSSLLGALQWGSYDKLSDVPGIDASAGFLDCHFIAWCAAREAMHPSK